MIKLQPLLAHLHLFYLALFQAHIFNYRRKKRLEFFDLESRDQAPVAKLDCRLTSACKSTLCVRASLNYDVFYGAITRLVDCYPSNPDRLVTLMALDLKAYKDFDDYLAALRKRSFFFRKANRSKNEGFVVEQFQYQNHTPDIRDIRASLKTREAGLPIDYFVLTHDALIKTPTFQIDIELPICDRHWEQWLGVFKPCPDYTQGYVTTNKKLLAYARLRRIGNTIKYAEFIGHGEALKHGIMMHLHLDVLKWIMSPDNPHTKGIDYLTYNTLERGNDGIFFWKRKGLFSPYIVEMNDTTLPHDFDPRTYLALNPDVGKEKRDPVIHYLLHGIAENRKYKIL